MAYEENALENFKITEGQILRYGKSNGKCCVFYEYAVEGDLYENKKPINCSQMDTVSIEQSIQVKFSISNPSISRIVDERFD